MKKMPVSVAIATFNGAEFLAEQLDSIIGQSVPVTEIVVCDDNSTDNTLKILEEYRKRYPEIFKIFRNELNLGCAGNFERALMLCSGDIIFLADQDDVWLPDKVEKMVAPFANKKVLGVYSDSRIVDHALIPCGKETHLQLRGYKIKKLLSLPQAEVFTRRVPPAAHDMAIRRSALKLLIPFPKLKNVHDTFIGVVIAAMNGWAVVPEPLTLFRQHASNASNSGKKAGIAAQFAAAKKSITDNTFLWNAQLYAFVKARLAQQLDDETEKLIHDRIAHSKARSQMGKVKFFRRLRLIAVEILTLRYFNFARGLKSIFQDLFLR